MSPDAVSHLVATRPPRSAAQAGHVVFDAREHGLRGDGITNDQPALAELVARLGAGYAADGIGRVIYCPPGNYAIRDAGTVWRSGVSLIGAGRGVTRFLLSNVGNRANPVPLAFFTTVEHGAGRDNHIADCTFANFEIDGSAVALADYHYLAKGLGLQYMLRGCFRDLYIHHTVATGLGCDFLQDTVIDAVVAIGCGREDNGVQWGGAGIGVGIGGWGPVERLTITNCTTVANGTNGIFLELQKPYWQPPTGIRITGCHSEGNRFGISDWGADGLVVSNCTLVGNLEAGFDISAQGTVGVAGRGGILADCLIDGNVHDGIRIGNTPGPYVVRGNRISRNGRHGYRQDELGRGYRAAAHALVVESNDIWGNGLDGILIERAVTDGAVVGNRIRDNGVQCAPAAAGSGETVSYTATTVTDTAAYWEPDGHRGKLLEVQGHDMAVVVGNTATELRLAPVGADALVAFTGPVPAPGTPYRLPAAPPVRAGLAITAPVHAATVRDNRMWDSRQPKTQTHGIWIGERGSCVACRVENNDLADNAVAATWFQTPPVGGNWSGNHDESHQG
ncbi:right-handed parallel beta-helix repeat-containing protein [Micromonosporaceae bacterium DT194]|uniref:right-handed parallel beta-helix repeat-containing protein n=1 Tax=Melissospora conviva TaxID=3388432 RepID=UPI003C292F92